MRDNKRNKITKKAGQKKILIGCVDIISIVLAFFAALWIRFDFSVDEIPVEYIHGYLNSIWIWCGICVVAFMVAKLYNSIWTFVSTDELFRITMTYLVLIAVGVGLAYLFDLQMPRSYYVLGLLFSYICTVSIRFSYRFLRQMTKLVNGFTHQTSHDNIMLIGAGEAGRVLVSEFQKSSYITGQIVCCIDDNPVKRGKIIGGIPIVGNRYDIPKAVEKYKVNKIIIAIPSCPAAEKKAILNICITTGCQVQTLPGIYQMVNGEVSITQLRKVDPIDLLGREPVSVNLDEIFHYISGKVVMVTGGGGSIGSELCRQIAKANPKQLIIFDIYENNAYDIQMELKRTHPELDLKTLIGSVRNTARVDAVVGEYRPDLVFHTAAHKHVPLMEDSPNEAIKNNVFGTYKMAQAAAKYGVKRFVLISTDKAVNPTNIMGASKRLCEMVVQMMNRRTETEFVAVRFGNVLGSNGSVIPLFRKQIEEGGPVTVTHPEIIRYFMTIPEAVSLVLQAVYYAKGGEIFVLDMGEPVKIDTMARNMIRLSGYEPDVDIPVVYTGLRPGEKLYEELLIAEEGLQGTENKLIHIGKPIEMDDELFQKQLERLDAAYRAEASDIKEIVAEIVPAYHPKGK